MLAGKSTNPDYDILQLQSVSTVKEDSFNLRVDQKLNTNWTVYGRYFRDQGTNDQPEGVTGRRSHIEANPSNGIAALQGILSPTMLNELKFGYNAAPTSIDGLAPTVNGIDLSRLTINLTGSVANTGIAGHFVPAGVVAEEAAPDRSHVALQSRLQDAVAASARRVADN